MKNNQKLKFILNFLLILVVLSIVLYFSLKDNYKEILATIFNMNIFFFIISCLLFVSYRAIVGLSVHNLTKINDEKISLLKAIQISLIIPFFHGVTPFAGGGQPMEIYYLHKEKISIVKATNITLKNFILYQMALVLMGMFALTYNYIFKIFPQNSLIKKLVILGFIINFLVLLVTYILSFGKRINKFILNKGIKLLAKTKLIHEEEATRKKLNDYLNNFHKNALKLLKNKKAVLFNVIINFFGIVFLYSVPYAVLRGLSVTNINLIDSIVSTAYTMTIGSFVPIPGGTGGVEYGYMFFYGKLIRGSVLNASMLIWRFITYYLAMIFGAIALTFYRRRDER